MYKILAIGIAFIIVGSGLMLWLYQNTTGQVPGMKPLHIDYRISGMQKTASFDGNQRINFIKINTQESEPIILKNNPLISYKFQDDQYLSDCTFEKNDRIKLDKFKLK